MISITRKLWREAPLIKLQKNCLATVDQYSVLVDTFPTVDRQTGGPNFGVHSADMKPRKC